MLSANWYGIDSIISNDNFKAILDQWYTLHPERIEIYDAVCPPSKLADGIPKNKLYVKLKDGITADEENYVLNGLRNQLETRSAAILYLSDVQKLIGSFDILRTTFVFLIGSIALVIAFFLLLSATT